MLLLFCLKTSQRRKSDERMVFIRCKELLKRIFIWNFWSLKITFFDENLFQTNRLGQVSFPFITFDPNLLIF